MAPAKDPSHWLYRFSAEEWLSAARTEIASAADAMSSRERRRGVAHARRAAGMALNAILVLAPDDAWGRSYMDHLKAVAHDAAATETLRSAAKELLDAPLDGPRLIPLGGTDEGPVIAARDVLQWAEQRVGSSPQIGS